MGKTQTQSTSKPPSQSVHNLSINPYLRPVIYQKSQQTNRLVNLRDIQSKCHSTLSLIHLSYSANHCFLHHNIHNQSVSSQTLWPVSQQFSRQTSRLKCSPTHKSSIFPFKLPACQEVRSASQPVNPGGPGVVLISLVSAEKLNLRMMDELSCWGNWSDRWQRRTHTPV